MTVAAGPQEFLLRAAALLPALRERANTTEELRRIPDETVEDLTGNTAWHVSQYSFGQSPAPETAGRRYTAREREAASVGAGGSA
jgi:hypothetical protein